MTDPPEGGDGADAEPTARGDGAVADESAGDSGSAVSPDSDPPAPAEASTDADASAGPPDSMQSADRTDDSPDVETPGVSRKLNSRVRVQWIVGPLVGAVVLGSIAAALAWQFAGSVTGLDTGTAILAAGVAVFGLFAVYGLARTTYLYRSWRYVVRDDSLYLTRGVFTRVQTVVPYVRVQHIDTRRSAFQRLLGLSTLVVYTAGSRGADVTIPGLTPERADDLQSRLKRLAIESEDEDAV